MSAAAVSVLLAACGSGGGGSSPRRSAHHKPARILALPAAVIAATAVTANGRVWVLVGASHARTLTDVQLTTGHTLATVPVSGAAESVARAPNGQLALGQATTTAGALQLLTAAGRPIRSIAVGAPVKAIAFDANGTHLYALNGSRTSTSVSVFDLATKRTTASVGVPRDTVSIAPAPDGAAVWSLSASGTVTETSLKNGRVMTTVPVGGRGIALALSPTGTSLYALKGSASAPNIAVVDTATSAMRKVLPAAAHSVALGLALNGEQLYDYVGAPRFGNLQIFNL